MAGGIHSKRGPIHSKIHLKITERKQSPKIPKGFWALLPRMEFSTHFRNTGVDLKCVENSIRGSEAQKPLGIFGDCFRSVIFKWILL